MATATTEPTSLRAGDSAAWVRSVEGYSPADGWQLAYALVPRSGGAKHTIATAVSGAGWSVDLKATDTAGYAPGAYTLVAVVSRGTERATIFTSACEVLPDLMEVDAQDTRSSAEKILAAIDAWLEKRAGWAGEKQVGDTRIKDHPLQDLLALRKTYEGIAARERSTKQLLDGTGAAPGRVWVRM